MKSFIKEFAALLVLAAVFVAISFLARSHQSFFAAVVESGGIFSKLGFVALTALFVIFIIPLDIAFLIPIAVSLWGPLPTALMSILGWVLGSSVAFFIARSFGTPVVATMIGLKRIRDMQARIPTKNLFWSVVMLRMFVSVDILSYALGLFSSIEWRSYMLATTLGVMPFGFYFAYTSTLALWYQIAAVGVVIALAAIVFLRYGLSKEV